MNRFYNLLDLSDIERKMIFEALTKPFIKEKIEENKYFQSSYIGNI